jgi:hypothetical protein
MSRYSHLPIYVEAQRILLEFYNRIPKFDKQYKYFLGGKLIEYSTNIVAVIMEINNSRDKQERINLMHQLEKNLDMLLVYTRIAYDLKQIKSDDSYMFLSEKIINVLKQSEGWKKYLTK